MSSGEYLNKQTHKFTAYKYNQFIKIGNYKDEFRILLNRLSGFRDNARYSKKPFDLTEDEAKQLIKTAEELEKFTLHQIQ